MSELTKGKRQSSRALWWGVGCLALAVLLVLVAAVGGGRAMGDNPLLLLVLLLVPVGLVLLVVGAVRRTR